MPSYQLAQGRTVSIPAAPLAVRVHSGAPGPAAQVRVVAVRGSAPVNEAEIRRPPGAEIQLIVVKPTDALVLRLEPESGPSFPPDKFVDVVLAAEFTRNSDPHRVLVNGIDLSGLPFKDVIQISPKDSSLEIGTLSGFAPRLHGLAKQAHDAARALLQRDTLPAEDVIDLRVIIDASASMTPWASSGLLGAVLDVVGGIDHVIGHDDMMDIRMSTDASWRRISADEASALATELIDGPRNCLPTPELPPPADRTATILVTDLVPTGWNPGARECCLVLADRESVALVAAGLRTIAVSPPWDVHNAVLDDAGLNRLVAGVLDAIVPDSLIRRVVAQ